VAAAAPALFPWRDAYSVRIVQIDNQHRDLIGLANSLHAAILKGSAAGMQARIMDELVRCSGNHFAFEEAVLGQRHYSGMASHADEHQRLAAELAAMRESLRSAPPAAGLELMLLLDKRISGHILACDQAYAREFKSR